MPDLARDPLITGKQAVEIKHTLKEPRSLADPVRTTGHTKELHLRDACWRQANGQLKETSLQLLVFSSVHYIPGQVANSQDTCINVSVLNIVYFPSKNPLYHWFIVPLNEIEEVLSHLFLSHLLHCKMWQTSRDTVVLCDIFKTIKKRRKEIHSCFW